MRLRQPKGDCEVGVAEILAIVVVVVVVILLIVYFVYEGVMLSARGQTAQGGMGFMYELQAIAMTVIGGTSLTGGRGSIVGTTLGMIIFGLIISGFTFIRVSAYYQEIIMGIIIVTAVVLDVYRQRLRGRI
jgi:inositol transport system permease protein